MPGPKVTPFDIRTLFRILAAVILLATLAANGALHAQVSPASPTPSLDAPVALPEETSQDSKNPCEQPPPLMRLEDYDGPLNKLVGLFSRKLERKSVHAPHYKPGAVLCSLRPRYKFSLFIQDTVDPVTFLNAGFSAGIAQAENLDPQFGQGAAGYGKRFGASFADQASAKFFKEFAYPTMFSEDPRYYRVAHGSGKTRLLHAMGHAFVAYQDDGRREFNYSEWLGTTSAVALSNVYHPGNKRGFAPTASLVGYSIGSDMGFDVLREFWPEICRKFKLPFRDEHEPAAP